MKKPRAPRAWNSTLPRPAKRSLQNSKPLRSHAIKGKRKPVKRRNAKRAKANHERAYGSKAKWIRRQPCHFCQSERGVEAAHAETGGMGYKAGSETLIPMCGGLNGCHRVIHRQGVKTFMKSHGMNASDLPRIAALYERTYQALRADVANDDDRFMDCDRLLAGGSQT